MKEITQEYTVKPEHTAKYIQDDLIDVLSTPTLVGFMESTCHQIILPDLEEGQGQVGMRVTLDHLAPTPVGRTVSVTAKLVAQNKRVYEFEVEAHDGVQTIGKGTHKRAVINMERFMDSIES